jgi:hypothetical protein
VSGDRGVLTANEADGLADAARLFADTEWSLPAGVFHLLAADDDLTQRPFQFRMRLTLCGQVVQPACLPPSPFPEGEQINRNPRYCPTCVGEAIRWSAGDK